MRRQRRQAGRFILGGAVALAAVTALAACSSSASSQSGSSQSSSSQSGGSSAGTLPVKIALIGPPPLNESLWADVAHDQGYFKDVGLNPSFTYFGHGTDVAKSVISGSVNVGLDPSTSNVELVAQGVKLVAVAGMDNQDWVIGVANPAVKTCQQLKGLTIGDDGPNNARRLFLGQVLQTCGMNLNDTGHVSIGSTPADIVKAAVSGQVQAAVLHISELAQIQAQAKVKTWHAVTAPAVIKSGHYSMFSVMSSYLGTPTGMQVTIRTIAAYILARNWIMNPANANAFAALTASAEGESTATALAGNNLLAKVPFWAPGNGLTPANVNGETAGLVAQGSVKKSAAPTYNDLVNLTIYPKALALAQKFAPSAQ